MVKKYRVSQTFASLGDQCAVTCATLAEAEAEARALRADIAAMVAEMETASEYQSDSFGNADEVDAWRHAGHLWRRIRRKYTATHAPESPPKYGLEAGEYIADEAVVIEEVAQ